MAQYKNVIFQTDSNNSSTAMTQAMNMVSQYFLGVDWETGWRNIPNTKLMMAIDYRYSSYLTINVRSQYQTDSGATMASTGSNINSEGLYYWGFRMCYVPGECLIIGNNVFKYKNLEFQSTGSGYSNSNYGQLFANPYDTDISNENGIPYVSYAKIAPSDYLVQQGKMILTPFASASGIIEGAWSVPSFLNYVGGIYIGNIFMFYAVGNINYGSSVVLDLSQV